MMNFNRPWAEYGHVISKWLFVAALACVVLAFVWLVFGPEPPQEVFRDPYE
jgi:hypothetical protein